MIFDLVWSGCKYLFMYQKTVVSLSPDQITSENNNDEVWVALGVWISRIGPIDTELAERHSAVSSCLQIFTYRGHICLRVDFPHYGMTDSGRLVYILICAKRKRIWIKNLSTPSPIAAVDLPLTLFCVYTFFGRGSQVTAAGFSRTRNLILTFEGTVIWNSNTECRLSVNVQLQFPHPSQLVIARSMSVRMIRFVCVCVCVLDKKRHTCCHVSSSQEE